MPFTAGRVSFNRSLVQASASSAAPVRTIGEDALERLNDNAFTATDLGVPLETEAGWTTAEHLLDTRFTHDKVVYDSGGLGLLGLRIDTNKAPAELKRALRAQHEQALSRDNPSGFASRAQKAEAKQAAEHELNERLAAGEFRKSSMSEVLWDVPGRTVLSAAGSNKVLEALAERFRATFDASLTAASTGALGYQHLASKGRERDFEDLKPSAFTAAPAGASSSEWADADEPSTPDVGWARSSGEPRDFLGNEMLIWLWKTIDQHEGLLELADPDDASKAARLAVAFDTSLELECAWGVTGKLSIREHAGGLAAARAAEAAEALSLGKWPRKVGLIVADNSAGEEAGQVWSLTLQADRWLISGCALPTTEEEFADARAEREWRLSRVVRIDRLLLAVYHHFLDLRTSAAWGEERESIRRWIKDHRARRVRGLGKAGVVEQKPAPLRVGA